MFRTTRTAFLVSLSVFVMTGCPTIDPTIDAGFSDAGPANTDAGPGNTDAGPGNTDAGPGNTDAGPGSSDAGPGNADAGPGNTDAGPGNTDAEPILEGSLMDPTMPADGLVQIESYMGTLLFGLQNDGTIISIEPTAETSLTDICEISTATLLSQFSGSFRDISSSRTSFCAVRYSGELFCYDIENDVSEIVPDGGYTKVGAGDDFHCAIDFAAGLTCWNDADTDSIDGLFQDVELEGQSATAITTDNRIVVVFPESDILGPFPETIAGLRDTESVSLFSGTCTRTRNIVALDSLAEQQLSLNINDAICTSLPHTQRNKIRRLATDSRWATDFETKSSVSTCWVSPDGRGHCTFVRVLDPDDVQCASFGSIVSAADKSVVDVLPMVNSAVYTPHDAIFLYADGSVDISTDWYENATGPIVGEFPDYQCQNACTVPDNWNGPVTAYNDGVCDCSYGDWDIDCDGDSDSGRRFTQWSDADQTFIMSVEINGTPFTGDAVVDQTCPIGEFCCAPEDQAAGACGNVGACEPITFQDGSCTDKWDHIGYCQEVTDTPLFCRCSPDCYADPTLPFCCTLNQDICSP